MIGTTHFTNAVVEARRLAPTGVIRLGLPATEALPPMVDWPTSAARGARRPRPPVPRRPRVRRAPDLTARPRRAEARRRGLRRERDPHGRDLVGLLAGERRGRAGGRGRDRRGAARRAHLPLARDRPDRPARARERDDHERLPARARGAHRGAPSTPRSRELGIDAPVYLSQNDGTLMTVEFAERYPVATFASGPTNSMRGAAFLSGLADCAVDRHRRHDLRRRRAPARLPARGVDRGRDRRRAHELPHAGRALDRPRRRLARRRRRGRAADRRLRADLAARWSSAATSLTATDIAVAAGLADIGDPGRVAGIDRGAARSRGSRSGSPRPSTG